MKTFYKTMIVLWLVAAGFNLIAFFTGGFDVDKLLICMLELLLAQNDYNAYKGSA